MNGGDNGQVTVIQKNADPENPEILRDEYDDEQPVVFQSTADPTNDGTCIDVCDKLHHNNEQDSDQWSECDPTEFNLEVLDTMLTAPDFVQSDERDFIYNFAPAEGNIPVSVFMEKNAEELAYPGIFCGQARPSNDERSVKVSYSEIVKSELRNADRRAASCVENIFFKTKKLQMEQLIDQTQIVVRKYKTKGQILTAKDVKGEQVKKFVHSDKAYKFMSNLRGSPPYFQTVSKDLYAMIRQLGPATFFCSLSAAETRWAHLLVILTKIVQHKDITEEQALKLTWQEKSYLIQSDPVTCARHFEFSVNKFISDFLLKKASPIGEIQDYFFRVEYQQRGSPHIHMMIWCDDAPIYGQDSNDDVTAYIDTYLSCHKPPSDTELAKLVNLQTHRHSHTCRKKGRKQCRFNFPKPPLRNTVILKPIDPQEPEYKDIALHKKNWTKVHDYLNKMDLEEEIEFEDFLQSLDLTELDYILSIRTSIRTDSVFLKRRSTEIRINSYNPSCLLAWRANLDLQYVLHVYACATYIASYITKAQRGMSELLRKACDEVKAGNQDLREQVRTIGNKFFNAVEISAQEAVYICLGIPMRKSTRHVIFNNTSPPDERVSLLKPLSQINKMDDEEEDIECSSLISRYANRPPAMENISLAEYAASYDGLEQSNYLNTSDEQGEIHSTSDDEEYLNEELNEEQQSICNKRDNVNLKKSKVPRIIRYVHFNLDTSPEKYFREQIMLFHPWRCEDSDLLGNCASYKDRHQELSETIHEERVTYEPCRDAIDDAEFLVNNVDLEEAWDNVAPNTEDLDGYTEHQTNATQKNSAEVETYDLGVRISTAKDDLNVMYEMNDEEFRSHMRSLTKEQIEFVYDTIHELKTSPTPIYRFLSGGAGVGKSHVTKALYQMAIKYYNKIAGEDFGTTKVLMVAPTGKAAYVIHGNTIHSAFKIAPNQRLEHKPLQSSTLNTFRSQLGDISLLIIDEISMVGYNLFNCIHQRLQELEQSKEHFGGVSLVVVGDFLQLKPVMDSYIFSLPSSRYMQLATNLWKEHFSMVELTEILWQKESKQFAELLNRLREGNMTTEDIQTLSTRIVKCTDNYPRHAVHLFTENQKVNQHNSSVMQCLDTTLYTVNSRDRIIGSMSSELKNKILTSFKQNPKAQTQLPATLTLVKDMSYDITVNIDTQDGIANGTSCKLMKIELPSTTAFPSAPLWVKYEYDDIGRGIRTNSKHLYKSFHDKTWTPLMPLSRQFAAGHKGEVQVHRLQYPLRPSAGKTIHRSQGCTMKEAVIDLSSSRKTDHIHYVALSRLTDINGLYITNLNHQKISVNKSVKEEMIRLRENKLKYSSNFLYDINANIKLMFLNARSLHRHLTDVKEDFSIMSANFIGFSETRYTTTDSTDATSLPGFFQFRHDSNISQETTRPYYGLSFFSKINIDKKNVIDIGSNGTEIMLSKIELESKLQLNLVYLYKYPKTTTSSLLDTLLLAHRKFLQNEKTVIMGDFNINWNKDSCDKRKLSSFTSSLGYHQLIQSPTTDLGSILDLIFTNIPVDKVSSGALEVYYSDHKIIWMSL